MSDLSELFARDPLKLTNEDIESIIQHYRNARQQHLIGDAKAGKAPKPAKGEKQPLNLSLDDLGL